MISTFPLVFGLVLAAGFQAEGANILRPRTSQPVAKRTSQENPVPQLMRNLEADNVRVAAAAARSLGVIFQPGPKRPEGIEPVIAKLRESLKAKRGGALRRASAEALGVIRAQQAVDDLQEAIGDEDVTVAVAAAEAVAKTLPQDEARSLLKTRAQEESENVQAAAYTALANIAKPEDLEFLKAGLEIDNWRVRAGTIKGLERAVQVGGTLEPETYQKIALVLGDDMRPATDAAYWFLVHLRNDEAVRAATQAAEFTGSVSSGSASSEDLSKASSQESSWRTRMYAIRVLRQIGWPRVKGSLPAVIRQLGDRTSNVQNEARNLLYGFRKDNRLTYEDLYELLLKELEEAQSPALKAGIMREINGRVPQQYASRVAAVASKGLTQAVQDEDLWVLRWRSLQLLGNSGYTGSLPEIAQCVSDDVANVRQAAGKALESLAPLCSAEEKASVAPHLQPLLEKPLDWRKTAIAARAAAGYATPEMTQPLIQLLSHSVINVQDAAAFALSVLVQDAQAEAKAAMERLLFAEIGQNPAAWEYGAKVLGATQNDKAIALLVPILRDGNWRAQWHAADAVSQIADLHTVNNQQLNQALIKASQSQTTQVQAAANHALRAVAKDEPTKE